MDVDKVVRIFYNIAANAADAMKEGGTLTVRSLQKNGHVLIEFSDTGCGIPGRDPRPGLRAVLHPWQEAWHRPRPGHREEDHGRPQRNGGTGIGSWQGDDDTLVFPG